MSVEFYRESPGKFDSRTLSREALSRWTGRRFPAGRATPRERRACAQYRCRGTLTNTGFTKETILSLLSHSF